MGLSDMLKDITKQAQDAAATHHDRIQAAVAKAETAADQRTGGQYHEQIANASAKVNEYVTKLAVRAPSATDATTDAEAQPGQPGQPRRPDPRDARSEPPEPTT